MLRSSYKTFQQKINKYTWYVNDTETKEPVPTAGPGMNKKYQYRSPKASSTYGHIHRSNVFIYN